jgi:hypothetical protein
VSPVPLCLTADGLGPPEGADDGLVGDGVGRCVGRGFGEPVAGGFDLGGTLLGGGVSEAPPWIVSTVPPGSKVIWLVHGPAGAARVAVAVTVRDCLASKVPELWLSAIHEFCVVAVHEIDAEPLLRSRIVTVFGSLECWLTLT